MSDSATPAEGTTTHDADAAIRWLHGNDPNGSSDDPRTVAEHLGIEPDWPGQASDEAVSNVIALADAALDADVILLGRPIDDVEFVRTTDEHAVLSGFRIIITTRAGAHLASEPLWAADLTSGQRGEAGAVTALRALTAHIAQVAAAYRAAASG